MSNLSYRSFASVLAYISVVLVGASLLISALLGTNQLASMFKMAADILAYIMLVIASFSYARSRRNVIFVIILAIKDRVYSKQQKRQYMQ